jgi:branched-subunit amino acid aminotransferase/4-amino-4-deoxychorismate lyase
VTVQDDGVFGLAMIDGAICSVSEAHIPINDRGFLFGQAVFETILVRRGHIVDLRGHLSRLERSCRQAAISWVNQAPPPTETLAWMAQTLVTEFYKRLLKSRSIQPRAEQDAQMRIIVTGGSSFSLYDLDCPPQYYLYCRALPQRQAEAAQERPVALKVVEDKRHPEFLSTKGNYYLPALLAFRAAWSAGFDDALYKNRQNEVTEATTANFIWEDHTGGIWTAPHEQNCLQGTTLTVLQDRQAAAGRPISYKALLTTEIAQQCRSAYLISSVKRVRQVGRIDNCHLDTDWGSRQAAHFNESLEAEDTADAADHCR